MHAETEEKILEIIDVVKNKANLISVVPQKQSLEDLFVDIIRGGKD